MKISNRKENEIFLSKNRRKLWKTHLKDNGWNSVRASGYGCIKIVDCMRNHFGRDLLRVISVLYEMEKQEDVGNHHQGCMKNSKG